MGLFGKKEKVEERNRPPSFKLKMAASLIDDAIAEIESAKLEYYNADNVDGLVDKISSRHSGTRIAHGIKSDLDQALKLAGEIKEVEPACSLDDGMTCDDVIASVYQLYGIIDFQRAGHHGLLIRRAQKSFQKAYDMMPMDERAWWIALCLHFQTHLNKGGSVVGIDGEKAYYTPFTPKKARRIAANAFEKVIELNPNGDLAIEAAKIIDKMRL